MGKPMSVKLSEPGPGADRRADARPTMVLRVGLLECEGRSSYCLLRNISPNGVQVKPYIPVRAGSEIRLRVGDENIVEGHVVWVRGALAGIEFKHTLDPATFLRVRQPSPSERRRASPRAQASGFAILRTGGKQYSATLCDISTSGAKIVTAKPIEPGETAVLLLPGLPALRGFVRWTREKETGVIFATPMPIKVVTDWLIDNPHVDAG